MILLVCGGRHFDDYTLVLDTLSKLRPRPILIIHGGSTGADELADQAAHELGIPTDIFRADWARYGAAAGPRRNHLMIQARPDLVIAFKGGKGTDDTIRRAHAAKIKVFNVGYASP